MSEKRLYSPGPEGAAKGDKFWIEQNGAPDCFIIGQGRHQILTIQNRIVTRIYNLLWKKIEDVVFTDASLNCHRTTDIVLGEQSQIAWGIEPKARGQAISTEEALRILPIPCGVQIHGTSSVVHSAVLLGSSIEKTPIGFHKDGANPMEICTFQAILDTYPRREQITFYEAPDGVLSPCASSLKRKDTPEKRSL